MNNIEVNMIRRAVCEKAGCKEDVAAFGNKCGEHPGAACLFPYGSPYYLGKSVHFSLLPVLSEIGVWLAQR